MPALCATAQTVLLYCRGDTAGCLITCAAAAAEAHPQRYKVPSSAAVQQLILCCLAAAAEEDHGRLVKSEEGSPSQERPPTQPNSRTTSPKCAQPSALSPDKQQQSTQEQPDQEDLDEERPLLFALNSFRRRRDSLNIRYSTSTYYDGQLYTPA